MRPLGILWQSVIFLQTGRERVQTEPVIEHPRPQQEFLKRFPARPLQLLNEGHFRTKGFADSGVHPQDRQIRLQGKCEVCSPLHMPVPQRACEYANAVDFCEGRINFFREPGPCEISVLHVDALYCLKVCRLKDTKTRFRL